MDKRIEARKGIVALRIRKRPPLMTLRIALGDFAPSITANEARYTASRRQTFSDQKDRNKWEVSSLPAVWMGATRTLFATRNKIL